MPLPDDGRELVIHAPQARAGAECQWARMRETQGLYQSDLYGGFHVASRYDDVLAVLTDAELFASGKGITLPPPDAIRSPHIPAEVDPPEHRAYRAIIQPLLTRPRVAAMEPAIRAIVSDLLDAVPDGEDFDFVAAFARPLPIRVTLHLMGLGAEHAGSLETMVEDLHREVATGTPTGASARLEAFARGVLDERRGAVDDAATDVVAAILLCTVFDRPLTPDEQMSMLRLVMVGGFDTTSIALATMMQWIATHPDDADGLLGDAARIDSACEDIVRFASPSTYLRREVTRACELGGTALEPGDSVLVAFGAANRDPARFDRPDSIEPDRKPNPHLGFGAGRHRCVGSFLAKAQMRLAFEEITRRYTGFALETSSPPLYSSGLGQGIVSLPLRMTRRAV